MRSEGTVAAAAILNIVHRGQISPGAVDLPTMTPLPEARWSTDVLHTVWATALAKGVTPYRLAEDTRLGDWGLVGYLAQTAETFHDALRVAMEHTPLITDRGRWVVEQGREVSARWVTTAPSSDEDAAAVVSTFAHFVACWLELAGPRAVRAVVLRSADFGARAWFMARDISVRAGADTDTIYFAPARGRPSHAHPGLHRLVRLEAAKRLGALPRADFVERVEHAVVDHLEHPAASVIARSVGMSERTLRRTLARADTSLSTVVEAVRRREASARLAEGWTVSEVAERLGYSDGSAFAKAFRRWTGSAPREVRDGGRAASVKASRLGGR